MTGALRHRTVQLHPSRHCNLACRHCYSSSGPHETEALPVTQLIAFLTEARAEGYECVAVSGGEPLLYPGLGGLLTAAKELGLWCVGVTNGTVHRDVDLALMAQFDLIAVSIDGPEPMHNTLRRSPTAFARAVSGLERMRERGIPFGIVHAATRDSLEHMAWLAEFAEGLGAQVLQLHPLGFVGEAAANLSALDGDTCARMHLAARYLAAEYGERLNIHVDLFNREELRLEGQPVVPPLADRGSTRPLGDLINPLVVMADGTLSPICHGMGAEHLIGSLGQGTLGQISAAYQTERYPAFRAFCQTLLDEVLAEEDAWPFFNWYELLELRSKAASVGAIGRTAIPA